MEKQNQGRSGEARDPDRPTSIDPDTGETEKEGLGRRAAGGDASSGASGTLDVTPAGEADAGEEEPAP